MFDENWWEFDWIKIVCLVAVCCTRMWLMALTCCSFQMLFVEIKLFSLSKSTFFFCRSITYWSGHHLSWTNSDRSTNWVHWHVSVTDSGSWYCCRWLVLFAFQCTSAFYLVPAEAHMSWSVCINQSTGQCSTVPVNVVCCQLDCQVV